MTKRVAYIGCTAAGTCNAHKNVTSWTGVITSGSGGATVNGVQLATIGDKGTTSCGHTFTIIEASGLFTGFNGQGIAREGDAVIVDQGGNGVITQGSDIFVTD